MGNSRNQTITEKSQLSKGITVRKHKRSSAIQLYFRYRGVDCRETIRLEPTKQNLKWAENLLGEIHNRIEVGSFNYADYFPDSKKATFFGHAASTITLGELFDIQLLIWKTTLQPSTLRGYRNSIKAHLRPKFGDYRVADITPSSLRAWISSLHLTAKTIRNIITPLRTVLDQAVNDDLIQKNPLDRVVLKQLFNHDTVTSDFEVDPFDRAEIRTILDSCQGQNCNLFQFAFFSGLRTSELIGLEWGDIDWTANIIRVSRAVVAKKVKSTKTKAGLREVQLLPPAKEALTRQKPFTFLAGGRIFHNPRTNQPWETDGQIRKTAWTHILKKAKIRYRNPYQTRHTYASMLLSAGENPWWVSQQMGHKNIEMVIRHYGKWIPDHNKQAGYQTVNDWGSVLDENCTASALTN